MELIFTETNLVDGVWDDAQPLAPMDPIRIHPEMLAGESVSSKLERIRTDMKTAETQTLLIGRQVFGQENASRIENENSDAKKIIFVCSKYTLVV